MLASKTKRGPLNWFKISMLIFVLAELAPVESIVGGHRAMESEAQFVVSIQNPTHICGGVLINPSWVLTLASCVESRTNMRVLAGSHRLLTSQTRITVSSVKIHPQYDATTGLQNIALLQLASPATDIAHAKTITISDTTVTTGVITAFYGWGALRYGTSAKSNELQTLYQRSLSRTDCAKMLVGTEELKTDYICAHVQRGQAACSNDQGGPLVTYTDGKLTGLYDHGIQCSGRFPDIFVDVTKFKSWIQTIVA